MHEPHFCFQGFTQDFSLCLEIFSLSLLIVLPCLRLPIWLFKPLSSLPSSGKSWMWLNRPHYLCSDITNTACNHICLHPSSPFLPFFHHHTTALHTSQIYTKSFYTRALMFHLRSSWSRLSFVLGILGFWSLLCGYHLTVPLLPSLYLFSPNWGLSYLWYPGPHSTSFLILVHSGCSKNSAHQRKCELIIMFPPFCTSRDGSQVQIVQLVINKVSQTVISFT